MNNIFYLFIHSLCIIIIMYMYNYFLKGTT